MAKMISSNRNSIARSIHSTINRDNLALVPLVNQRNEEIHGFPRNLAALNRLTGVEGLSTLILDSNSNHA